MNCFYLVTVFALFLFACNHTVTPPAPPANSTYIKYRVNGAPFQLVSDSNDLSPTHQRVYMIKASQGSVQSTTYILNGESGTDKNIVIELLTDSLSIGTFTTPSLTNSLQAMPLSQVMIGSERYSTHRLVDSMKVTISRLSSGRIDGVFSGTFSLEKTVNGVRTFTPAVITEGSFQNVKISY